MHIYINILSRIQDKVQNSVIVLLHTQFLFSDEMASAFSADPDQTALDQGLQCLPFHQVFWETSA